MKSSFRSLRRLAESLSLDMTSGHWEDPSWRVQLQDLARDPGTPTSTLAAVLQVCLKNAELNYAGKVRQLRQDNPEIDYPDRDQVDTYRRAVMRELAANPSVQTSDLLTMVRLGFVAEVFSNSVLPLLALENPSAMYDFLRNVYSDHVPLMAGHVQPIIGRRVGALSWVGITVHFYQTGWVELDAHNISYYLPFFPSFTELLTTQHMLFREALSKEAGAAKQPQIGYHLTKRDIPDVIRSSVEYEHGISHAVLGVLASEGVHI